MSKFTEVIKEVEENEKNGRGMFVVSWSHAKLAVRWTGTLKRSITHDTRSEDIKTKGAVGSNVEYAYWAERNQPYLEPAVDQNMENIKRRIKEVMRWRQSVSI